MADNTERGGPLLFASRVKMIDGIGGEQITLVIGRNERGEIDSLLIEEGAGVEPDPAKAEN